MSNVIDVIFHKNMYSTQRFLILDTMPELLYEEKIINGTKCLFASDGIFSSLYYYEKPSKYAQAFAGRQFKIPMKDGGFIEAKGQWWDGRSSSNIISVGVGSKEQLDQCYVFISHEINKDIAENIFNNFKKPSNNYYKYDKKNKNYMKNTIVSKF